LDELTFNLEEMGSPVIMTAMRAEYLCRYFLLPLLGFCICAVIFCLKNQPCEKHAESRRSRHMAHMLPRPIRVAGVLLLLFIWRLATISWALPPPQDWSMA